MHLQDLRVLGSLSALKELHFDADHDWEPIIAAPAQMPALEQLNIITPPLLPKLLAALALPALKTLSVSLFDDPNDIEPAYMDGHELDCISFLTTLEGFVFHNVRLADDSKLSLSAPPRLASLKLSSTRIQPGAVLLRGAAALRELELDLNPVRLDDAVVAAVKALPQLRKLKVSYECGCSQTYSFKRLLHLGQLQQTLQARGCQLMT